MAKILVVEDDQELAFKLRVNLEAAGYKTEVVHTGLDALQILNGFSFDLVLLDWHLPDITGLELCRRFRKSGGGTQIIFLTGVSDISSKEDALNSGGDDFLCKPFDSRELLARIRSVTRRSTSFLNDKLQLGRVSLDVKSKKLKIDDKLVQLSSTESDLIEFLIRNPDRLFSSAQLLAAVWPTSAEIAEDTVRVRMSVIRKKLELAGCVNFIKTVRGAGYLVEST